MPTYAKVIAIICAIIIVLYSCSRAKKEQREKEIFQFNETWNRCEEILSEQYEKEGNPRANDSQFIKYKCYYDIQHDSTWWDNSYPSEY